MSDSSRCRPGFSVGSNPSFLITSAENAFFVDDLFSSRSRPSSPFSTSPPFLRLFVVFLPGQLSSSHSSLPSPPRPSPRALSQRYVDGWMYMWTWTWTNSRGARQVEKRRRERPSGQGNTQIGALAGSARATQTQGSWATACTYLPSSNELPGTTTSEGCRYCCIYIY